ncbi:MAG: lipase family protein [Halothece sp. Uz-M2-17]|nr:lipase family protein [Halothece sp. Uz-M2-17]
MNYSQALRSALLSKEIYQAFSQIKFSDFPNVTPVLIDQDSTGTQCAMFLDSTEAVIYIIFRGSEERVDWSTNFDFKKVAFQNNVIQKEIMQPREEVYPYSKQSQSGAKMHQGFVNAYLSVREQVHDYLQRHTASKVIVTGHSLGGALSTLAAVDIQYWFGEQLAIAIYTFGSPRVGNSGFRESFLKRIPDSYRFVYGMDLVPALPRPWQGYRHVETEYRLGSRFSLNFFSQRFRDHDIDNYVTALQELV